MAADKCFEVNPPEGLPYRVLQGALLDDKEEIIDAVPQSGTVRYIAAHLEEELSVEALASRFYLSRYYLMHRFKAITGYTVHQYISQKRLLRAGELIRAGTPVMKAAEAVGFREYSTFLRAFQNTFHVSPREFHK